MTRAGEAEPVPTLAEMSARGREIACAYFEAGVIDGIAIGRHQLEAEWRALDLAAFAAARSTASTLAFDELADRRGQHDRAERQRAILRERGIA